MGQEGKCCFIIGAAPARDPRYLLRYLPQNAFVICADGGVELAPRCGITPQLAVGDFDSYAGSPDSLPADLPVVPLNPRKDDTDMLAAVNAGLSRGYHRFVLAGALGGRLDHSYANLCVLQYLREKDCDAFLAGEDEEAFLLKEGETRLFQKKPGTLFSVFPFSCPVCNVSYTGMRYPLDHHDLFSSASRLPMGISNVAEKGECSISVHHGLALVIVPASS